MRMGISIAVVVAIALIWSVLTMSGLVPVVSDDVARTPTTHSRH
jgi:hypothetical protein